MNSREIKNILHDAEVIPARQLGQNFLCDSHIASKIVDLIHPSENDTVVECGPGTGALTVHLIGRVKRLILIEFDARLAEYQSNLYKDREDVIVHHADAARFPTTTLYKYGPIKLLGNLPYSSGGAIMRNFMKRPSLVLRAVLMLQKEFIDRIMAQPCTKDYGVLSLRMQSEWNTHPAMLVPPHAFIPPPKIDSTVIVSEMKAQKEVPVYDARLFDELIRRGFSQRRKQLKKQLPNHLPWVELAQNLNLKITARAEEISLENWIEITRYYDDHPLKDIPQKDDELLDIVNDNDEVIHQDSRANAHAKKLTHRASHVFVANKRNEILLQKRSILKDKFPGCWGSSAAGHLAVGETYQQCAVRELNEEVGITNVETQKMGKLPPSEKNGYEFIELFCAKYSGSTRLPCSEVFAVEWFPIEEINAWTHARPSDFAPGFLECWKLFVQVSDRVNLC